MKDLLKVWKVTWLYRKDDVYQYTINEMFGKGAFNEYYSSKLDTFIDVMIYTGIVLGIILGLVALFFVFALLLSPLKIAECNSKAQSFLHYWDFWGGCMVKYNDYWLPLEQVIQLLK